MSDELVPVNITYQRGYKQGVIAEAARQEAYWRNEGDKLYNELTNAVALCEGVVARLNELAELAKGLREPKIFDTRLQMLSTQFGAASAKLKDMAIKTRQPQVFLDEIMQTSSAIRQAIEAGLSPHSDGGAALREIIPQYASFNLDFRVYLQKDVKYGGKNRDEVLNRISPVVYRCRKLGVSHAGAFLKARIELRKQGDLEAVARMNKENTHEKQKTFARNMLKREKNRIQKVAGE